MEVDSETKLLNLFVVTNCDLDKAINCNLIPV